MPNTVLNSWTAELDSKSFEFLREQLHTRTGIHLTSTKLDLVRGRLRGRLSALKLETFEEYVRYLTKLSHNDPEWQQFINRMTTNKTDFFRESAHFDYLTREVLSKYQSRQPLRVWSAASSTGEEPYTLAMVLAAHEAAASGFSFELDATDIDTEVLEMAQRGIYPRARLEEIPQNYHRSSFVFGTSGIENWVMVKPALKARVRFSQCNLMWPEFPFTKPFDVVFCRNVLIYFTSDTIKQVIDRIYRQVAPNGILFLGHSESIHNLGTSWEYVKPSIYRKRG